MNIFSPRNLAAAALGVVAALATAPLAHADLSADMNRFFDDLNLSNVTTPGVYEGQSAGYFTGGGVFMRVPQRNYTLYSVQWPRFRAGCGGIDFFAGGFSFINAQEFVNMLRNIGSAAVSQAFMLALRTISPQIASTMEQIKSWEQELNINNINSCEAARDLMGGAMEVFGVQNATCIMERVERYGEAWAEARQACGPGGQRRATMQNSTMKKLAFTEGNLAWRAMMRNSFFRGDTELAQVMMSLSGTVVITPRNPDQEDTQYDFNSVPSVLLGGEGAQLIEAMLKGGTVEISTCSDPRPDEDACVKMGARQIVTVNPGLVARVREMLDDIALRIEADQSLDATQRGLLSATTLPVHKYLTVSVAYLPGLVQSETGVYATLIAKDILYTYINDLMGEMIKSVHVLGNREDDRIKDFLDGLSKARLEVMRYKDGVRRQFDAELEFTNKTRMYEQALVGRLSPGMFRSLMWAAAR